MNLDYQSAALNELPEIMAIETSGFSPAEAATETAMAQRIKEYPDTFIVAKADHQIVGYIVGPASHQRYIDDDLFEHAQPNDPTAAYQTVLSLVVHPDFRGHGIASQLLEELKRVATAQNRQAITLTCLKDLIGFYERNGYRNEGVSDSSHAHEVWYNMVLMLHKS